MGIQQAHRMARVASANYQGAALTIGKGAYPFQMLVSPRSLPLQVLVFGLHLGRFVKPEGGVAVRRLGRHRLELQLVNHPVKSPP